MAFFRLFRVDVFEILPDRDPSESANNQSFRLGVLKPIRIGVFATHPNWDPSGLVKSELFQADKIGTVTGCQNRETSGSPKSGAFWIDLNVILPD